MRKEIIVTAKTIEEAKIIGVRELNIKIEDAAIEVIELPKKGFLGLGATDAKIKVIGEMGRADAAAAFLANIIKHMQVDAKVKIIEETEKEIKIDIVGHSLGSLIGYHGEILDSLQYLTYLAVNKDDAGEDEDAGEKKKGSAVKITIDIENYRSKREETLKGLAKKMADRVLKYGRSVTLEPMNAYERRIIHATIQDIDGVLTHSIGQDNERKIIISKERANNKPYGSAYSKRPRR